MAELSRMAAENLPQLLAGAWLTVQLMALAMVTGPRWPSPSHACGRRGTGG